MAFLLTLLVRRLVQGVIIVLIVSFTIFALLRIVPGDPVRLMLGPMTPDNVIEQEAERLGLRDPIPVQYGRYLISVLQGDFGTSFTRAPYGASVAGGRDPSTGQRASVLSLISSRFPDNSGHRDADQFRVRGHQHHRRPYLRLCRPEARLMMAITVDTSASSYREERSATARLWLEAWSYPQFRLGLFLFVVILVTAIAWPLISTFSATKIAVSSRFLPPAFFTGGTWEHLLGTDQLGRDGRFLACSVRRSTWP